MQKMVDSFISKLLGRPNGSSGELMFYLWRFATRYPKSLDRSPWKWHFATWSITGWILIQSKNAGGRSPKNGAKNTQNFCGFFATSDFDSKYIRNGSKYPKSESQLFQIDFSCILRNRFDELRSTNYRDLDVSLDPLKWTFSGDNILAIRGSCPEI